MFGRLAAVRVKAAEDAFENGRLDEAFEIVSADDLGGHRRVRILLEKLAEPFLLRGQDHLLGQRFTDALADFERAARCGSLAEKAAEWRKRALDAMTDDRRTEHEKQAALAAARERLAAGSLGAAEEALAGAPADDTDRDGVAAAIDRQKQRAEAALGAAEVALKDGRLVDAVERLLTAKALHGRLDGITEMETRTVRSVLTQASEDFKDGRLRRAEQDLAALGELGRGRSDRIEMVEALRLAREAAGALTEDRYAKAGVLLGRLTRIGPKAGWIADVRKHLSVLEQHRRALLVGPLGLILGRDVPSTVGASSSRAPGLGPRAPGHDTRAPGRDARAPGRDARAPGLGPRAPGLGRGALSPNAESPHADETLPAEARGERAGRAAAPRPRPGALAPRRGGLPKRLLLRIDGVGTFLLLRSERISIGRAGPGATAALQLISDLSERQAEIIRAGEDYFVVARSGVELAGRHVDHALLQDGDRIRLGKRIGLKFRRPSLKSTTAALDLGEGVRTTTDCRRVMLWGGPLLMGSTRECHIRLTPDVGGAILLERDGQLFIKQMGPGGRVTPVPLGVQTQLGELRLSVQPWSDQSGAGKVIG